MAGLGFNPQTTQGNLNRVATHIVVPTFPQLNANAGYMSKGLAVVTFEPPFVEQIETATGIVNSPRPFVMGQIVINLLRSQILANAWTLQVQANATIGTVLAFPDSNTLVPFSLSNASIYDLDPGAFDGVDPTFKVTLKGTFYINAAMWATLTGPAGNLPI
jgi:hypothetical protein